MTTIRDAHLSGSLLATSPMAQPLPKPAVAMGPPKLDFVLTKGEMFHTPTRTVFHNPNIERTASRRYCSARLQELRSPLERLGMFTIAKLPNGLPQAAATLGATDPSAHGYDHVWTRDAVLIALSALECNATNEAKTTFDPLLAYYNSDSQRGRLREGILHGVHDHGGSRPHIRFRGFPLGDSEQAWGHAQNDAMGLMMFGPLAMARRSNVELTEPQLESLSAIAAYLHRLDVTTDREFGHWEEAGDQVGRVQASTLRCVLAGFQELRRWMQGSPERAVRLEQALENVLGDRGDAQVLTFTDGGTQLNGTIDKIASKLGELLPFESRGEGPVYDRLCDIALTTALWVDGLCAKEDQVIDRAMTRTIIANLDTLRGSHGYRRYTLDGYYALDRENPHVEGALNDISLEQRAERMIPGTEAEWTLADPILSAIHGRLYLEDGDRRDLAKQGFHFNRALGAILGPDSRFGEVGAGAMPESFRHEPHAASETPTFAPNPLPLNWSKAYFQVAYQRMCETALAYESKLSETRGSLVDILGGSLKLTAAHRSAQGSLT